MIEEVALLKQVRESELAVETTLMFLVVSSLVSKESGEDLGKALKELQGNG